jgi:hypothetical protein
LMNGFIWKLRNWAPPNGSRFSGVRRLAKQLPEHLGRTSFYHASLGEKPQHVPATSCYSAVLGADRSNTSPHR